MIAKNQNLVEILQIILYIDVFLSFRLVNCINPDDAHSCQNTFEVYFFYQIFLLFH